MKRVNPRLTPRGLLRGFVLNRKWPLHRVIDFEIRKPSQAEQMLASETLSSALEGDDKDIFIFYKSIFVEEEHLETENISYITRISFGKDKNNDSNRVLIFTLYSCLRSNPQFFSPLVTITYVFHKKIGTMKRIDVHHISSEFGNLFFDELILGTNDLNQNSTFSLILDSIQDWLSDFAYIEVTF